jgi:hypothetical protein
VQRVGKPLLLVSDQSGNEQDSPAWMDSWQRLGAILAKNTTDVVPGKYRRLVISATTPTREFAAVMAALGMVRVSYRDRMLPDPVEQFRHLAGLPAGTMVRAVLGGHKVELGPVEGADQKGNLRFGRKTIAPAGCADISQLPWLKPAWRERKIDDIIYDSAFIKNMVPRATPCLFASDAKTVCAVMGPAKDLKEESNLLVARPDNSARLRPVHEVLRPFERYGEMGWHSVICSSQSHDWPEPVADRLPRLVILDGAAAVQRWVGGTYEAEIVLALVHRSDSSAVPAAEAVLNQRRSALKFDLGNLGWTPPAAVEAIAFGEPA